MPSKAFQTGRTRLLARAVTKQLNRNFSPKSEVRTAAVQANKLIALDGQLFESSVDRSQIGNAIEVVNVARPSAAIYAPAIGAGLLSGTSGSGGSSSTDNSAAINLLSASLNSHKSKDFVEAHPTNPSTNRHGTYYSINFGIVGGASVDESANLLNMLNIVGQNGGGYCVLRAVSPTDPIYINSVVSIYYSNVHLVILSPIIYGATGSIRIMGEFAQTSRRPGGQSMGLRSSVTTNGSGQSVLHLRTGEGAYVAVGDKLVIRGENDASGKALSKDVSYVLSISGDDVTMVDQFEYGPYDPTYPSSAWLPDHTTGTTIYLIPGTLFTTNVTAGSMVMPVTDATTVAVGDVVSVSDNRNEYMMNAAAINGSGNPYVNPANLEFAYVIARDTVSSPNTVTLDRAVERDYNTANYGGVYKLLPVFESTISEARISYNADQTSKSFHALQIAYGVNCAVFNCKVDGSNGRMAHAIRISYSLNCAAFRNRVLNAKFTASGEGYGITIYYSTLCRVFENFITGCRHNILLQLATLADVHDNESRDARISGIDMHGVYDVKAHIYNNRFIHSNGSTSDSSKASGCRDGNTSHVGGSRGTWIAGNYFSGFYNTDASAIDVVANSKDTIIEYNIIDGAYYGIRTTLNSSQITPVQPIVNLTIRGNVFRRCTYRTLSVTGQPTAGTSNGKVDGLFILDNISDRNSRHYEITGASGVINVILNGNKVINPTNNPGSNGYGIKVSDVVGLEIHNNNLNKCNRGISLTNCTGPARVSGNRLLALVDGVTYAYTDGGGNSGLVWTENRDDNGVGINDSAYLASLHVGRGSGNDGTAVFKGTTNASHFNYSTSEDTYIRGGKAGSKVHINDGNIGDVLLAEGGGGVVVGGASPNGAKLYIDNGSASAGRDEIVIASNAPEITWIENDGGLDGKYWDVLVNGGHWMLRAVNDAGNAATTIVDIARSGMTVGNVVINGTVNGGRPVIHTKVTATLTTPQTNTGNIPHDNSVPLITEGDQILSYSYTPSAASRIIKVRAVVPYMEISSTGPVQMSIFAGSTCIAATTRRITTGGSSGSDMEIEGEFTSASTSALTIQVRMGSDTAGPSITLCSKFGGALTQPWMTIEEFA